MTPIVFQTDLVVAKAMAKAGKQPVLLMCCTKGCFTCIQEQNVMNRSAVVNALVQTTVPCWLDIWQGAAYQSPLNPVTIPYIKGLAGSSLPVQVVIDGASADGMWLWRTAGFLAAPWETLALKRGLAYYKPPA